MDSFTDKWKKERAEKRNEERTRLLALTDGEAEKLPVPDRYQRIRYLREIEADQYLQDLRRKMPAPLAVTAKRRKSSTEWNRD